MEAIARELTDYQYYNADAVNARIQVCFQLSTHSLHARPPPPPLSFFPPSFSLSSLSPPQLIKATMANMGELAAVRTQRIQEAIEKQQQLDELRLNFAKKGAVRVLFFYSFSAKSNQSILPPPPPSLKGIQ